MSMTSCDSLYFKQMFGTFFFFRISRLAWRLFTHELCDQYGLTSTFLIPNLLRARTVRGPGDTLFRLGNSRDLCTLQF